MVKPLTGKYQLIFFNRVEVWVILSLNSLNFSPSKQKRDNEWCGLTCLHGESSRGLGSTSQHRVLLSQLSLITLFKDICVSSEILKRKYFLFLWEKRMAISSFQYKLFFIMWKYNYTNKLLLNWLLTLIRILHCILVTAQDAVTVTAIVTVFCTISTECLQLFLLWKQLIF